MAPITGKTVDRGTILARLGLAVSVLTAPLLVRFSLRLHDGAPLSSQDGIGVLSDLGVSLIVVALLVSLAPRLRLFAIAVVVVWSLLNYASFEHTRELGTALQFTFADYAVDSTFATGSMLSVSSPVLLLVTLVASTLGCVLFGFSGAEPARAWRFLAGGIALLVALSVASALSEVDRRLSWRERHFVHQGLEQAGLEWDSAAGHRAARAPESPVFIADLSGAPRIELPQPGRNVLLLVLEGLPAFMLDSIAAPGRGGELRGLMPRLNERTAEAMSASNFVLHQRQTNRGLYSLVCGRYPKLRALTSRMTEYASEGGEPCLPERLGAASYRTVFIQGAPLSFMLKGAFAESVGFDEIYGDRHFEDPIIRTAWGVDDRTLFRDTAQLIRRLEGEARPWFVTVLTAGTHHPFLSVPASANRGADEPGFADAARYLDAAVGEFLDTLEAQGTLENTLVLITADESRGADFPADIPSLLTQSWGPMLVLLPTREVLTVQEPYGQSDVALSILDFLGIDPEGAGFIGRSLFRHYATPRRVYFANVFQRYTGAVDSKGEVLFCNARGESCSKSASDPAALFLAEGRKAVPEPSELVELQTVIVRTLGDPAPSRDYSLLGSLEAPLLPTSLQVVMGGQNIYVPARSRVEVTIDWTLEGGAGRADLLYRLFPKGERPIYRTQIRPLSAGDRVQLHLVYGTLEPIRNLRSRLDARNTTTSDLRIRFQTAALRIRPLDEGDPPRESGFVTEPELRVISSNEGDPR